MYTNKINGMSYIGQTKGNLKNRLTEHLSGEQYIDKALRKYGIANFKIEILEDNIPLESLDKKEIYYIEKYDTYNNGYNLTSGGKPHQYFKKFSDETCDAIARTILNTDYSFLKISELFSVKLSLVSDINRGRRLIDGKNYNYPLRKTTQKTKLTDELVAIIIYKLKNDNEKSADQIGDELGISGYTVGQINRGKSAFCKDLNEEFPIRKKQYKNKDNAGANFKKISREQLKEIVELLLTTKLSIEEISRRYNVTRSTIDRINQIKTWERELNKFIKPIRQHREENLLILNEWN